MCCEGGRGVVVGGGRSYRWLWEEVEAAPSQSSLQIPTLDLVTVLLTVTPHRKVSKCEKH